MKYTQTDNQVQITQGATVAVICGLIFTSIGAGTAIVGLHLPNSNHSQRVVGSDGSVTTTAAHAGLYVLLFGLVFLIIGILVLLSARKTATTIVKGGDTTISAKRLFGGHQVQQTFPTSSITGVRLNTYMGGGDSSNASTGGRQSTLSLLLPDNAVAPIASKGSSGGLSVNGLNISSLIMKAPLSKEAQALSTFLNVPLDASDMSSLPAMIHTVENAWQQSGERPTPQTIMAAITQGAHEPAAAVSSTLPVSTPTLSSPQMTEPAVVPPSNLTAPKV